MNKKLTLSFVSALVATSAVASVVTTYDPNNTPTKIADDKYVKLSVPTGVEEAVFDGAGRTGLFYVIMDTANPNEDADISIVNGFSAVRDKTGEILTFKQAAAGAGNDAVMTLKQGTYNFATSDTSELIITAQGNSNNTDSTRAVIFDVDTTTNIFTSTAKMQGVSNAKIVSRGNMNIYNTAYTTSVPSDVAYGQFHTYGTFVQESGTINANDLLVESVKATFSGTLNLKQTVASGSHYPIEILADRGLTFGSNAVLTTTSGSRIKMNNNSALTVESGEKTIQADLIYLGGNRITLNLLGKNSFYHTNGKFETTLLTYASKERVDITVADTNTFGATFFATGKAGNNESVRLYIDFDFTSDDQYLNLGRVYTGKGATGVDPIFYVKDFKNGYLRATTIVKSGTEGVGDTKLYVFNEASQTYEFVEAEWIGDATNGYILTIAVPEPAEWAMIFGGIALAFAIYRRRK